MFGSFGHLCESERTVAVRRPLDRIDGLQVPRTADLDRDESLGGLGDLDDAKLV